MNTSDKSARRNERLAKALERSDDYRVLRRVPARFTNMPEGGAPPDGFCVALVDLETTSLDASDGHIIELALMLVWLSDEGDVIGHFGPLNWLEDPGVPIPAEITMVTGLAAQHLVGKKINDASVAGLLSRADLLCAHNAKFEVSWLEKRYPELGGKAWACSMADIDWLKAGCDGRAQQHLLSQHGWFSNAHRAADDVWSLFVLLQESRRGCERKSRTHFQRLLAAANRVTTLVQATRAPFSKKDLLKGRGYRWNSSGRVWQKELDKSLVAHEQAWFFRSGLPAPTLAPMSAHERHR